MQVGYTFVSNAWKWLKRQKCNVVSRVETRRVAPHDEHVTVTVHADGVGGDIMLNGGGMMVHEAWPPGPGGAPTIAEADEHEAHGEQEDTAGAMQMRSPFWNAAAGGM